MSKNRRLFIITALVKDILKQDERARNSDSYLYWCVCNHYAQENGVDLSQISVSTFLLGMTVYGFPPFESVRRSRQKLQARFPELSADETVAEFRAENETEFRAFAVADIN